MEGNKRKIDDTFAHCSKSKKCQKTEPKENKRSAFEIFCLRFPIAAHYGVI